MEASTTIRGMLAGNKIIVPNYQRAYSWETPKEKDDRKRHTDVFLADLNEYRKGNVETPYYFGHFLFEKKDNIYYVIDGQQRLTTIVIFISVLFAKLKDIRELTMDEVVCFEDMVIRHGFVSFSTVDYDNQFFVDYVITQTRKDKHGLDTESSKRIAFAFDYFKKYLPNKDDKYLTQMLRIISESACTTHPVYSEPQAIQMFIFQNNRGKKPSNLEVIKAQFMYNVHLYGNEYKDNLITEIKERFEKIYKFISLIEYKVDEDDVLLYTLRVYFNSLWEENALDKINKKLFEENPIPFIQEFTQSLSISFEHLTTFFGKDERKNTAIHSLVTLGSIAIAIPFIIKAYNYGLEIDEINKLCASLESLVLRHRLIGTRADVRSRINDVFEKFTENNKNTQDIIKQINYMKKTKDWWWAHWNDDKLNESIQGAINHSVAKYLLWKYENWLESQGKPGYFRRFDSIINPELEHIAPINEPDKKKKPHGYGKYDEEFRNHYLNCLGNYLLLSLAHNRSAGNKPFPVKYKDYTHLEQQREIQRLVPKNGPWGKTIIQKRKNKIISFILNNC
jgi:hypothetical protein